MKKINFFATLFIAVFALGVVNVSAKEIPVTDEATFRDALNSAVTGDTVILNNSITLSSKDYAPEVTGKEITIDGKDFTITGWRDEAGSLLSDQSIITAGANGIVHLKNVTLTNAQKLEKMESMTAPVVYIGDTFKDIELLQKSYVGISRGGLADPKVVENSDIVLIDADLNRVYETFVIARKMRTIAVANNILTVVVKVAMLITALSWTVVPLWAIVLIEILLKAFVMRNSTCIL